ncbi:general vesicular transport factor p115 [Cyprinus carpio]|uniref:General vesicular transport factor p115 n=1 Tax=Cyprinus carpio TaxID=7962 RepID=A0A9Q9VYF9_CYPCA|nr:general vesicular transport factor p115 [Cyprinus carpio]
MNYIWEVVGRHPTGQQPTGAETIQKLCDRVASSTLLEDRRDAVRALKSLSKKYRMEVGTMAMDHLVRILQTDRADTETLGYALDTLYNIICSDEEEEPDDSEEENQQKQEDDLGAQFTEKFIQEPDNITLLLTLLEEFDFHVRWPGVKLLTALLKSQCAPVQGIILVSPMGVSRLMDLLADSREVIRNDGLLLLQQLTKGNTAIQKIVAFENAFERLLEIITEEGSSDGGIVVEDCLLLLLNLLKNNSSNQNFFKEGSYIQKMKSWFEVGDDNSGWSAQKVTNLHLMLQLVRVMVSPVNSPGATASCQKAMFQCDLLQQLCTILMATGVPADILTETINTVSEVIRGSEVNQDYFASVNAPSNPPRPAIVVLLMSMVNERQPFVLRCAVLYCFQCSVVFHFISQGDKLNRRFAVSAISFLLTYLLISQMLKMCVSQYKCVWQYECVIKTFIIVCFCFCVQGSRVQTKVGLLMLLCTWISNCPIAVMHFLHNQDNVPFLTGQISENLGEDERLVQGLCALLLGICIYYNDNSLENYTKEKLKQLIEKRIGKENFVEKLAFITKHELYSRAAQKPQPAFSTPEHMLFDHEFTKLVKELEGMITKAVLRSSEEEKKEEEVKKTLEQHDSIVTQYKELIREQDSQINELKEQVALLTSQNEKLQNTTTQQFSQIQQHKDQYNILKLKLGKDNQQTGNQAEAAHVNGLQPEELSQLREQLEELQRQNQLLQTQLTEKDSLITSLKAEGVPSAERSTSEVTELQKEVELLKAQLQSQTAEITQLQSERQELLRGSESTAAAPGGDSVYTEKTAELESRLSAQTAETQKLKGEVKTLLESKELMEKELASATSTTAIMQAEKSKLQQEVQESKKEQDDLLMLLADQDQKILSLKQRLKDLGETIEDEDDLDSRDQFDDDDDDDDDEECDE